MYLWLIAQVPLELLKWLTPDVFHVLPFVMKDTLLI